LTHDTASAAACAGDATVLLDLDGLAVTAVALSEAGARVVRVETADETAAACPTCGVFSTRVKEYVWTRPRDLPPGWARILVEWRKRRWYCREPLCARKSFTESVSAVPAGARITTRLREHAGELVVDGQCATVAAAGRATGVCPGRR
jgi:transposase